MKWKCDTCGDPCVLVADEGNNPIGCPWKLPEFQEWKELPWVDTETKDCIKCEISTK